MKMLNLEIKLRTVLAMCGAGRGIVFASVLLFLPALGFSQETKWEDLGVITLFSGESRVVPGVGIKRISVGNVGIVSSTLLDETGEIVLIGEQPGETNLQIWGVGGKRANIPLIVIETNTWRELIEVKQLLGKTEGLSIGTVGSRIVVDGTIDVRSLDRIKLVKERYPDVLVLAREITEFEQKMLHFDIRITEVNKNLSDKLGIDWSTSFAGPSLSYENIWNAKSLGQKIPAESNPVGALLGAAVNPIDMALNYQSSSDGLSLSQQRQLLDASERGYTYWGIGANITSLINILESNGGALTLAKPRLSARSGGKASLTVGGDIPVVTSSVSGQSVTYKPYGIILSIAPTIDLENNISAQVSIEVSQVDIANNVGDQPAFSTRSTENDVKLSPGETLALAGIIKRDEGMQYNQVKWLGDIPILGNLFKSRTFNQGESELVILITPTEITDPAKGVNEELVNRAQELVDEFNVKKTKTMNLNK